MARRITLKMLAWAFIAGGVLIIVAGISWVHGIVFGLIGSAALKFAIPQIEKMDREQEEMQRYIVELRENRKKIRAQTVALVQERQEFQEFIERMREQGLAT